MKKLMLICIGGLFSISCFSQNIQQFKGKTYIFDAYEQIAECDNLGTALGTPITAEKGSLFTIERVPDAMHLVIKFLKWKQNNNTNRDKYNKFNTKKVLLKSGESTTEPVFFILDIAIFNASCSEYTVTQKWDLTIGTLTTPFKFRKGPFLFSPNLNLGTSLSYQRKFKSNFTWGLVAGLSLSSVTLDSFSTKGFVKTNTDRPAVTPSFHGMLGYKNINITFGLGWDFINKTSETEKSWVYNGKRWFGIGLGINLFNTNTNSQSTTPDKGQK